MLSYYGIFCKSSIDNSSARTHRHRAGAWWQASALKNSSEQTLPKVFIFGERGIVGEGWLGPTYVRQGLRIITKPILLTTGKGVAVRCKHEKAQALIRSTLEHPRQSLLTAIYWFSRFPLCLFHNLRGATSIRGAIGTSKVDRGDSFSNQHMNSASRSAGPSEKRLCMPILTVTIGPSKSRRKAKVFVSSCGSWTVAEWFIRTAHLPAMP